MRGNGAYASAPSEPIIPALRTAAHIGVSHNALIASRVDADAVGVVTVAVGVGFAT